jgi:cobalt-precorrin 5A hydrolase / precorrin-3B C17-methyltransferase
MQIAVVVLNQKSVAIGRQIVAAIPDAKLYGLQKRVTGADVGFDEFTTTVQALFQQGVAVVGLCAAGILIRTIAPLLNNKWQEPPLLAVAEDGSAIVPLLGGLNGANTLAHQIGAILQTPAAITTSGEIRFRAELLSPPAGYELVNPENGKEFIAELLAGKSVRIVGDADWLWESDLPIDAAAALSIVFGDGIPGPDCLVYRMSTQDKSGKLSIVGTGPGAIDWMTPEVQQVLQQSTDWFGYTTYLNLVEPLRTHQLRHDSDNREELDRARAALNLAAQGKAVAMVSSGDPGIYAMAAAVFEAMETDDKPEWRSLSIQVCPGISAMQAAASQIGAPIGHDFCAISLSDILKPWETIEQRIAHAAEADFVIAFYNPISSQRRWQLEKAKETLLKYRDRDTPIVLAENVGRPGQNLRVKPLGDLQNEDANMRTILLIGSSKTRVFHQGDRQWVYTPRRYDR